MSTLSVATVSSCTTVKSASTTTVPAFQNSSGTANGFLIRAWCKFSGSGDVANTAVGGNISSAADNGEGDYTVNFEVAFPDTNYCQLTGSDNTSSQIRVNCRVDQATGSYRFVTRGASDNKNDPNNGMIAFVA